MRLFSKKSAIICFAILLVTSGSLVGVKSIVAENEKTSACAGRQWKDSAEQLDCRFPYPPIGRWKAVYTEAFAKEYDLTPKNISTDFSPGIDYMEMVVQPFGYKRGIACMVNMLVKKPHDIAFFNLGNEVMPGLSQNRKLMRFIDIDKHKDKLKAITTFSSVSRDYMLRKKGFRHTTFAIYAEDVLPGYDYIAANMHCRDLSLHPQYFPDGMALWAAKASVWGRYETHIKHAEDPNRPRGMDFYNSNIFINIPHELISTVFEDVPLGGR